MTAKQRRAPSRAITLLVGWGIALQAFGAIYRPEALGFLAASPGVLLLLMAALLSLPYALTDGTTLRAWLLLGWGAAVSLVAAAVFGWNPLYASKVVPLLILSMAWIAPLLCLRSLTRGMLTKALCAGLAITCIGYVLGDLFPSALPETLRALIFGGGYETYVDSRPRAFMSETSQFAAIFGRYAILLYLVLEVGRPCKLSRLVISVLFIAAMLLVTESKGAAFSMALTLLALSMGRKSFGWALLLAPAAWWITDSQIEQIAFDIENFTSTSTRVGLWVAGLAAFGTNPLGWGFYGFYGSVERFGTWSMDQLSTLPFLFTELQTIVGDLTSVSYKSTLLDFSVVFGLPFWMLMVRAIKQVDVSDPRARCALVYLAFSSFSTGSHESIAFFLGLAILYRFYPRLPPTSTRTTLRS